MTLGACFTLYKDPLQLDYKDSLSSLTIKTLPPARLQKLSLSLQLVYIDSLSFYIKTIASLAYFISYLFRVFGSFGQSWNPSILKNIWSLLILLKNTRIILVSNFNLVLFFKKNQSRSAQIWIEIPYITSSDFTVIEHQIFISSPNWMDFCTINRLVPQIYIIILFLRSISETDETAEAIILKFSTKDSLGSWA